MSDILDVEPRPTNAAPTTGAARHIEAAAPRVAIVGATGAVGEALLDCLAKRNFPLGGLTLRGRENSKPQPADLIGDENSKVEEDVKKGEKYAIMLQGKITRKVVKQTVRVWVTVLWLRED